MKQLFLLYFLSMLTLSARAQWAGGPDLSWEDFVHEYFSPDEVSDEGAGYEEQMSQLEELSLHPLQVNRATRADFLTLPFLSEAQADSLLAYRQNKHGLLSLGELQFVTGFDYFTRRYLSLFVRCDSSMLPSPERLVQLRRTERLGAKLTAGRHELESRLDVPMYRRRADRTPDVPTPTNYYTGNSLHHVVRYRYDYKREAAYGLTMEKDAGEPVGKQGFYPYDYLSGYMLLRPEGRRWSFVLGDYEVRGNQGLLFGRRIYGGREQLMHTAVRNGTRFRAHTSTDESRFFRGGAAAYRMENADAMFFVSYRKLDARFEEGTDTARHILQTGLHRTVSEIERRRNLGTLTAGAHWGYTRPHWTLSADGYVVHFDHPVWPEERRYNAGYFRGGTAGGASVSYSVNHRSLNVQGEVAADHRFHLATSHLATFAPSSCVSLYAQLRLFSSRFVSIYGEALQQGGRVANEQGVMCGVKYRPKSYWEITAYADAFRFPEPTYTTVNPGAKGLELSLQSQWRIRSKWLLTARYRFKSRERTVTGYEQMEFRTTHKVRIAVCRSRQYVEWNAQADAVFATRQTGKQSFGWMCSVRPVWRPSARFRLKGFAAVFFTDDNESALYACEPQLLRAGAFPSFFHHGVRGVLLSDWKVISSFCVGVRLSSTYYFNRKTIASGYAEINARCKSDLSVQLRWCL